VVAFVHRKRYNDDDTVNDYEVIHVTEKHISD